MHKALTQTFYKISYLIIVLTIIASAGGILLQNLYRDNQFVTQVWKTTDLVTLSVAIPLFITSLLLASRGSQRAHLILLAMLDYTLYNYAYYLFAAAFNWFFLIYVALFTLSVAAMIIGLLKIDAKQIMEQFRDSTPVKWISAYMLFVAAGLTIIYLIMTASFIVTGRLPVIVEKTGHPTNVVFALDLSFVVPVLVLGAIWLWNRRPWGYILAAISVVKGTLYTFVLAIVSLVTAQAGPEDSIGEFPLWITLSIGGLLASLFLLGNMKVSVKK